MQTYNKFSLHFETSSFTCSLIPLIWLTKSGVIFLANQKFHSIAKLNQRCHQIMILSMWFKHFPVRRATSLLGKPREGLYGPHSDQEFPLMNMHEHFIKKDLWVSEIRQINTLYKSRYILGSRHSGMWWQ